MSGTHPHDNWQRLIFFFRSGKNDMLAKKAEQLARGVARHLLTYATGEPASALDDPAVNALVATTAKENYGLRSLVHAVVPSEAFRFK